MSVIGDAIQDSIVREVKTAQYYCAIANEVTDAANCEELSPVLRYLLDDKIMEVFMDFLEVERITGKIQGDSILNWLHTYDISVTSMCYDWASNMSGARSGVKAVILEVAPKAIYYYCVAHRLNFSVVSACKLQPIKKCESCIGKIARFFLAIQQKGKGFMIELLMLVNTQQQQKSLKMLVGHAGWKGLIPMLFPRTPSCCTSVFRSNCPPSFTSRVRNRLELGWRNNHQSE